MSAKDGADAQPKALFEAQCNHVGYVAANLAVRWGADGGRLLYVNDQGSSQTRHKRTSRHKPSEIESVPRLNVEKRFCESLCAGIR